ncbi:MAG TPA: AMP nucleosidase [Alphaproteobacteria bacterium]|jgi:AMP nucleosidase|nr:AMP nucleosidase [Alphaproteobacteria bacterium]
MSSEPPSSPAAEPRLFADAESALAYVRTIYDGQVRSLTKRFQDYAAGEAFVGRQRAFYPYVQITIGTLARLDSRLSYGFVRGPGVFRASLTRPDLFEDYYREQFEALLKNHGVPLEVGLSNRAIPIHFALGENLHVEAQLTSERLAVVGDVFDLPNLAELDDAVPNGAYFLPSADRQPLALFTAPRVDLSVQRLRHYTATSAEHFQRFVLFTNYQFYVDEFVRLGLSMMEAGEGDDYVAFVEPGNRITLNRRLDPEAQPIGARPGRLPQMPAYHLKRADGSGITLINIGIGPSNAKTITDHVAVLRPHAWLMLGHCAGLRATQKLGDYVLAHAYVRDDHVLDEVLPTWVPLPALAEVQQALERAVAETTGLSGYDLKGLMRTGTIMTVDDRNWELRPHAELLLRFNLSRAIALDMESATIAANGYRFRVPYGTLLCVSDKPMHGHLKLPNMADLFYREQVDQHLQIGIRSLEILREAGLERLHSRKLRSFVETGFR